MEDFFQGISNLTLSEQERIDMEAPVTLKELKQLVAEMSCQKSPGPDGLPLDIYKDMARYYSQNC